MAWLGDWAKRVKLTIDNADITAGLVNFPMLLYLSTSSGRGPDDISFIFDELGSDANRKKIAVTTSDGETQCYVEIEKWDHGNEKAWLWVKVPSIASDADTDLYLYYDSSKADNTTYVGDCADGSAATHAVWDSDFKMVLHMEGASATEIDDSTENNNDVSGDNGTPLYQQAGKIGNAVDFEKASSEYLTVPDAGSLDLTGDFTIEGWVRPDAFSNLAWHILLGKEHWNDSTGYLIMIDTEQGVASPTLSGETDSDLLMPWGTVLATGTWYYLVMRLTSGTLDVLLNTVSEGTEGGHTVTANAQDLLIGSRHVNDGGPGNDYFDGVIDEVRISAISRNAAWIKASYECQVDDLLDWGIEEESPPVEGNPWYCYAQQQ